MRTQSRCITLLLAALALAAPALYAGDFLNSGASARSLSLGGAYLPGSDSVLDSMAMNPAGLALLSAPRLDLSVTSMFARGSFENSANSNGRLDSNGAIPYGAFGTPIGNTRFSFGVAALPELLSAARWHYVDTPGGVGGVSYGPLNQNSEIVAVRAAAGMGVRFGDRVQIGATFGAVYNTNTLEAAYIFQNNPALSGLKTLLDLHTSGVGWKGTAGALVKVSRAVQLGVSYQSRTNIASKGVATGNAGVQFAAIGLGAARPDFRYDAEVDNVLPQSVMTNVVWQMNSHTRLVGQGEWTNWSQAFTSLPVILTHGNNADINGVLGSDSIRDSIPLNWKNQVVGRIGIERSVTENLGFRAGYAQASSMVPEQTLSPLTAAITRNTLSVGGGYNLGRCRIDLTYSFDPRVERSVGQSALKAGEYSNSTVKVGTQALVLSTSFRL